MLKWSSVVLVFLVFGAECHKEFGRAYEHRPSCDNKNFEGSMIIESLADTIVPKDTVNYLKGYSGTISVVGGSFEHSNEAYFAAITAMKMGADFVQIFTYKKAANFLKGLNPNIAVHPYLDEEFDKIMPLITKSDLVILGPGLEEDAHCQNTVIPRVIIHCKNERKPLIIDINTFFITQNTINHIMKYPYPGIIMTPNWMEFDELYKFIKIKSESDANVISINYDMLGPNVFILRKGCVDSGISSDPTSSWSTGAMASPKRSSGQGHMLAGAVGMYYFWALNKIPMRNGKDPMFTASIAAFAASRLIRSCSFSAYQEMQISMITSDMVEKISCKMYGEEICS